MLKLLLTVIMLVGAGLLVDASLRPIYRLRAKMPQEFVDASNSLPAEKRAGEQKIANAYWDCAVGEIQWRYGYGYRLPQDPPNDFIVPAPDVGADSADPVTRARYWLKLQRAWYVPDNWTKSYQWDSRWMTDWVASTKRLLHAS